MRLGIYKRNEDTILFPEMTTTDTGATATGNTEIDCRNAKKIIIQIDQLATTYAGADTDINIFTRSKDSTTYDTVPFHEATAFGSAAIESFTVSPAGFAYMKFTADNNSTSASAKPKLIVQVLA